MVYKYEIKKQKSRAAMWIYNTAKGETWRKWRERLSRRGHRYLCRWCRCKVSSSSG